ncbi:MAG: hypothetical protein DRP01_01495 [Archaeoglobales archaeon]|nr:MAG: hypothetical protein DRP01_01495 [Archaeoglobales archaeon]
MIKMLEVEDIFSFILIVTGLAACFVCVCSAVLSGDLLLLIIAVIVVVYILLAYFVLRRLMK